MWFLAGFLIVFVGMLFFFTTYDMLPSGRGIVKTNLWEYYSLRVPLMFKAQALGPGTVRSSAVMLTLVQHTICAAFGGLVALAIGWKAKMRRQRRTGA